MITKKNIPLILGFSIPILMILFVAVSIYIPGLFFQPRYNFLYITNGNFYNGSEIYSVQSGRLFKNQWPINTYPNQRQYPSPQLYMHNVIKNESSQVSFQTAQNFSLDSSTESPDRYKLENGNSGNGFFPFFWNNSDYYSKYLVGHNSSKKLNIKHIGSSHYDSIQFLGWIIQ